MTEMHGFELIREQAVPEINSKVRLLRHVKTGAELLSVENDDENKCFAATFATPPDASDGIAHILEHSVLNGSRKYPVKEPFVELLKSSMASFINAFTFADKTMYPVASTNTADFYNLIDVYLDAVFHPRISPEILKQEGWHYELEDVNAPLTYKGVVFNEMKGAYSSPDRLLGVFSQRALFPDNLYGVDSGGDPAVIPTLTYEKFKRFHETYYHPSNARIYFWGDDDPQERLRVVDEYLSEFEPIEVETQIDLHPRFDEPQRHVFGYDSGDDTENKGMISVDWALPVEKERELIMAMSVLGRVLLGTSSAPLRKALTDSGLGEDVIGGFSNGMRQMTFSAGMKGIDPANAQQVESLVTDTLTALATEGIDEKTVEAAVNTTEFSLRELNTGGFPRGLALLIGVTSDWLYGMDPITPLAFEQPLEALKTRLDNGEHVLENLIKTYLLENPHRSTTVLQPDETVKEKREADEQARLDAARAAMDADDLERIVEETAYLQKLQNTPDSSEDLEKIPALGLSDLEKNARTLPLTELEINGEKILYHDLPTNGIFYVDVGFDLSGVPQDLLPYMSLFSRALVEMGTEKEDFVKLQQRIGSKTGGISPSRMGTRVWDSDDYTFWLFLRGKATTDHVDDLFDIMLDIIRTANFDDKERFKQIVMRAKAGKEAQLIPAGHQITMTRMKARYGLDSYISELTGGVENLFFLRDLIKRIDDDWDTVLAALESIRKHLLHRGGVLVNATIEQEHWSSIEPKLANFIDGLPAGTLQPQQWAAAFPHENEGLTVPAQVNYVGESANLYDLGYTLDGSVHVIVKSLARGYLWNKIRVMGGAYGALLRFDQKSGVLAFVSYRDPNLLETLKAYDEAADFLKTLEMSQSDVEKAIVGTVGDLDSYQLPDAKGYTSMVRYLTNYNDETRQQIRDQVMSTTLEDFRAFGDVLARMRDAASVVVMGSQDHFEAVKDTLPLKLTKVL